MKDIFGFFKTFEKVTKNLGFQQMLETNVLQDIIYTSMDDDIKVTIITLYLFVPSLIPSVETQLMFNEATQKNYEISFDEWYTGRRVISDMIVQHDIGSAQQVNSPKYLICAHQTKDRINAPNKKDNIAIFHYVDLRKYHVEINSLRYPKDSLLIDYEQNEYIEQYNDIKLFCKEYKGELVLNPFISYPDMKTKNPIEIIDLRHQPDQITPKKIQLFQEPGTDPDNARLFLILIRRRENEMISDGKKLIEVEVFQNDHT